MTSLVRLQNGRGLWFNNSNFATMITAELKYNNKSLNCLLNKSTVVDDLYTFFTIEENIDPPQYKRLKLDIHPKKDIVLKSLEIRIKTVLDKNNDRVFCNGFQSASESRAYNFSEKPAHIPRFLSPYFGATGDENFDFIPRKKGILHSWTYAYHTQSNANKIHFIGSLSEATCFTVILYDVENQEIIIKKDLENLHLTHSFPALDVVMLTVNTPSVLLAFDTYFSLQNTRTVAYTQAERTPALTPLKIAVSEHSSGLVLNENSLAEKLDFYKKSDSNLDIFHLENGWSNYIGDWLSPKPNVSTDMKKTVQSIHNQGVKASLSLSPFVVETDSFIFNQKKDWILRGGKEGDNKPVFVDFSPDGTKKLYALDFYHKEVQDYLTGIFHTVLNKWGFDAVKLDYLYAVCILPRPHKTRGQIMHDAMLFLREMVDSKTLMAADVPLGSAFGTVDYCQVSPNADRKNGNWLSSFLKHRELANPYFALKTALNRWQLNGRAFKTVLDSNPVDYLNFNEKQFDTLLLVPILLKNTHFLPRFKGGSIEKLTALKKYENSILKNVYPCTDDVYALEFSLNEKDFTAYCNISGKKRIFKTIELEAYQTFIAEY
jgi:alpha-galactosidase